MKSGIFIAVLAMLTLFVCSSQAADLNYPYGRVSLKLPPSENPYPGLGNYYSTLAKGMKSVLWNPASLGKLKLSEASISTVLAMGSYDMTKTSSVEEKGGTFEVGAGTAGGKATMDYALFFRPYSAVTGIGTATKEVEIQSDLNYATSSTGINFSVAQRINDWLIIGFASNNPLEANLDLAGNFPVTGRMSMDLKGKSMGDMVITNDGKLKYTFTSPGGTLTTPETVSSVWSGFLSQEVTIPFTNISELRNNLNFQSPYIATVASQFRNFYAGINILPISATAQMDNDVRTVVNADTPDQLIYVPNFDPNNQSQGANWIADPDKYGTQAGYSRKQIKLPSGEIVADAKYRGFYNGSTARMDFGIMYDIADWLTFGMALENIGGTSLNLKGNGLAAYLDHRDINTSEAENLFRPGKILPGRHLPTPG